MPTTTTCPSCNGPLRIPDELVGQRVRCPVCQTIFDASAPAPAAPPPDEAPPDPQPPLWKNLNLELGGDDAAAAENPPAPPSAPPPSSRKPGLVGAVEVGSPGNDEGPAPRPAAPPPGREPRLPSRSPEPPSGGPPPGSRPRDPLIYDDEDQPRRRPGPYGRDYRRDYRRRDTEPHRGVLILVLGLISLVSVILTFCYIGPLIGIPLGITAWVLGNGDLRKIKNHEMDEEGLGTTQAGWICGIVGTVLNSLILLACGGFLSFVLISANSVATRPRPPFNPPPAPATAPAPAPVVKDKVKDK